jgi:hypothetical protein
VSGPVNTLTHCLTLPDTAGTSADAGCLRRCERSSTPGRTPETARERDGRHRYYRSGGNGKALVFGHAAFDLSAANGSMLLSLSNGLMSAQV